MTVGPGILSTACFDHREGTVTTGRDKPLFQCSPAWSVLVVMDCMWENRLTPWCHHGACSKSYSCSFMTWQGSSRMPHVSAHFAEGQPFPGMITALGGQEWFPKALGQNMLPQRVIEGQHVLQAVWQDIGCQVHPCHMLCLIQTYEFSNMPCWRNEEIMFRIGQSCRELWLVFWCGQ